MRGVCLVLLALLVPSYAWGQQGCAKGELGPTRFCIEVQNTKTLKNAEGREFGSRASCFILREGKLEERRTTQANVRKFWYRVEGERRGAECPTDTLLFVSILELEKLQAIGWRIELLK